MGIGSVSGAVCEGILRSALAAGVMQIFIENLLVVLKKGRGGAAPPFGLPEIFLKKKDNLSKKNLWVRIFPIVRILVWADSA
jgi:hypothetical protein